MQQKHQVVHRALRTAVGTLALSLGHEQRLLALLDEAHESFSKGKMAEGIIMLRRFSFQLHAASRSHLRPTRLLGRETPYDRLSCARRRRAEPAPG